jgi:hypothetical protein
MVWQRSQVIATTAVQSLVQPSIARVRTLVNRSSLQWSSMRTGAHRTHSNGNGNNHRTYTNQTMNGSGNDSINNIARIGCMLLGGSVVTIVMARRSHADAATPLPPVTTPVAVAPTSTAVTPAPAPTPVRQTFKKGGLWKRLIAQILDVLILSVPMVLFSYNYNHSVLIDDGIIGFCIIWFILIG